MSRAFPGVPVVSAETAEREQLAMLGLAWVCGYCHGTTRVYTGSKAGCPRCEGTGFVMHVRENEEETQRIVAELTKCGRRHGINFP